MAKSATQSGIHQNFERNCNLTEWIQEKPQTIETNTEYVKEMCRENWIMRTWTQALAYEKAVAFTIGQRGGGLTQKCEQFTSCYFVSSSIKNVVFKIESIRNDSDRKLDQIIHVCVYFGSSKHAINDEKTRTYIVCHTYMEKDKKYTHWMNPCVSSNRSNRCWANFLLFFKFISHAASDC